VPHTITAASPLPDDLRQAINAINPSSATLVREPAFVMVFECPAQGAPPGDGSGAGCWNLAGAVATVQVRSLTWMPNAPSGSSG
jgi:hypothetical protein